MKSLRLILEDQLSTSISSLAGYDKKTDVILLCDVWEEATYVKHHQKKIALLFSAMRHFAQALSDAGYHVHYTQLNDQENTGSLLTEVKRMLSNYALNQVVVTEAA